MRHARLSRFRTMAALLVAPAGALHAAPPGILPMVVENLNTFQGRQQIDLQLPYFVDEIKQIYRVQDCSAGACTGIRNDDLYVDGLLAPASDPANPQVLITHEPGQQRLRIELRWLNQEVCALLTHPAGTLAQRQWDWYIQVDERRDANGNVINGAYATRACQAGAFDFMRPLLREISGNNNLVIYPFPAGASFVSRLAAPPPPPPPPPAPPPPQTAQPSLAPCASIVDPSLAFPAVLFGNMAACDASPNSAQCTQALSCQLAAIRIVKQGGATTGEQKRELLTALLAPGAEPGSKKPYPQRQLTSAVSAQVEVLYEDRPEDYVLPAFKAAEEVRLRTFAAKVRVPLGATWSAINDAGKRLYLESVIKAYCDELGITARPTLVFTNNENPVGAHARWALAWTGWISEGGFDRSTNRIELDRVGVVTQRQTYRTLFEELNHARQWQLVQQLEAGTLTPGSIEFQQANRFAVNYIWYVNGRLNEATYNVQPLEYWAKAAAELMADIVFQ